MVMFAGDTVRYSEHVFFPPSDNPTCYANSPGYWCLLSFQYNHLLTHSCQLVTLQIFLFPLVVKLRAAIDSLLKPVRKINTTQMHIILH